MTNRRHKPEVTEVSKETEDLINRVCSTFAAKIETRLEAIESKIEAVRTTIKDISKVATENKNKLEITERRVHNLEQIQNSNTLRFLGIPEEEDENVLAKIIEVIRTKLTVFCHENDINKVFRLGQTSEDQPRAVLVQFVRNIKCFEVLSARKLLKESGIVIFEELTRDGYQLLQKAKRKYGKKNAWSTGGKIFVWLTKEQKKITISCTNDL